MDIVFVHGLRGSFYKTWREQCPTTDVDHVCRRAVVRGSVCVGPRPIFPPISRTRGRVALCLFVSCPWTTLPLFRCPATPQHPLSLQQYAHFIRGELIKAGVGTRPVVFVGHSMGGLIVKHVLAEEFEG